MYNMFNKRNLNISIILLLPVIFFVGVQILVKHNTHTLCIFKLFTGHECWGCGMTRAFNELFHLNFDKAYSFNPRIVIAAPLLFYIWVSTLIREIKIVNK